MDRDRWLFSDHSKSWGDHGSFYGDQNMIVAHNYILWVIVNDAKHKIFPD